LGCAQFCVRCTSCSLPALAHVDLFSGESGYDFEKDYLILIARDPKDVAVSFFYWMFFRVPHQYNSWKAKIPYSLRHWYYCRFYFHRHAYNVANGWREFTLRWLDREPLIVRYEDLLEDPVEEIYRVTSHFGLEFHLRYAEEARDFCDFSKMVEREKVEEDENRHEEARFFRSGKSEVWEEYFRPQVSARFDDLVREAATRLGY
ncbi:MAG: sulfotransferase domain-containing protein, partial [Anaerolineae bacterium]|nr:sulfotransferase domain-containing protein [Anaerolineae bacterium]